MGTTCRTIILSHRHLHTLPHHPCDDMALRSSLTKFRERVKRLSKSGANLGDGTSGPLSPRPDPGMVEDRVRREDSKTGGGGNPTPQSVVGTGSTNQGNPHPSAEVWRAVSSSLDRVRGDPATPKDQSTRKPTVTLAAGLLLPVVERASNTFPLLKSVVMALCSILDNCEVRSTIVRSICDAHSPPSKRRSTNKQ